MVKKAERTHLVDTTLPPNAFCFAYAFIQRQSAAFLGTM